MPNILHLHRFWRKFSSLLVSAAVRIFSSLGTRTMRDSKPCKGRIGLAISETFWWLSMEVTLVIRTWEQWGSQQVIGCGFGWIWSDLVGCGWCWLGFSCSRVWNQKSWSYSLCWYNSRHGFSWGRLRVLCCAWPDSANGWFRWGGRWHLAMINWDQLGRDADVQFMGEVLIHVDPCWSMLIPPVLLCMGCMASAISQVAS